MYAVLHISHRERPIKWLDLAILINSGVETNGLRVYDLGKPINQDAAFH